MTRCEQALNDPRVAIAKAATRGYGETHAAEAQAEEMIARVSKSLGWFDEARGPFGNVISEGARVLIKPNWVMHENQGPWGIDPLVTHSSLVRAAVAAALEANPSEVVVG